MVIGGIVGLIVLIVAIIVMVVAITVMVVVIVKRYEKVINEGKELFESIKKDNNIDFKILVNDNYFASRKGVFFFYDMESRTFGVDLSGKIYSAKDIVGYKIINQRAAGQNKIYNQILFIYLIGEDNHIQYENHIEIAFNSSFYSVFSEEYSNRKHELQKVIDVLNQMTKPNIDNYYNSINFVPTEEFFDDGQLFAYNRETRQVVTKDRGSVKPITYNASEIIRYKIVEDTVNKSSLDLSGFLLGSGHSAFMVGDKITKFCKELKLLLLVDGRADEYTCDTYEFIRDCESAVGLEFYKQQKRKMQDLIDMINCTIHEK